MFWAVLGKKENTCQGSAMRRVGLSDSAIVKRGGRGDGDVPKGTSLGSRFRT